LSETKSGSKLAVDPGFSLALNPGYLLPVIMIAEKAAAMLRRA